MTSPDTSQEELVERIYQTVLDPHSYDEFMALWDSHMSVLLNQTGSPVDTGLNRHFEIAFQILEDQGRSTPGILFGDESPSARPTLLIDGEGRIVWTNRAAEERFGLTLRATIADLRLSDADSAELRARLPGDAQSDGDPPIHLFKIAHQDQPGFAVMTARYTQEPNGARLLLLEDVHQEWPNGMPELLDSFGLSPAEKEITEQLFEGLDSNAIAEMRQSSPATVRTQVKKILTKTGSHSQAELNRLLSALARVAERKVADQSHDTVTPHQIRVGDRVIHYYQYGPAAGRPVIFFHGMLDSCLLTARMVALLFQHNLRIIAPVRPSFGIAEPDKGDIRTAPARFGQDVRALMDALGLRQVTLLGHLGGSIYSHAAAAELGPRATGMVCVSGGVPILSNRQFATMSRRQRLVAHTAKYTPSLLKFVLRAGIRQIDYGGIRHFMTALFQDSPADRQSLQDTEIYDIVKRGYRFAVAQGHQGFEIDSYQVVRDWTETVRAHTLPMILIHGRSDPVVDPASVEAFAHQFGNRTKLWMQDGGQLLLHTRPELAIDALVELLDGERLGA